MNALVTLVRPFVRIVAHQLGPDALPPSRLLLGLVITLHLAIYTLDLWVLDAAGPRLVALPLLDVVAQSLFFGVLLMAMGWAARVLQTLIAVFGADLVLGMLYLPVALGAQAGPATAAGALASIAALGLLLLSLGVKGHILNRATGLPYVVGVVLAMGLTLTLLALDRALFPAA